MWYTIGLLCGLLLAVLAGSPHADVQCDGEDDRLNSVLTLANFINPTAFTLTAWVLSTGSTFTGDDCWGDGPMLMDANEVVGLGRSGTTGTGNACVFLDDGASQLVTSPLSAGWHHLAGRLSGGTLALFVDGVSVGTPVAAGAVSSLTATLHLCGQVDGTSPDRMTEVLVFATGLPPAEIEQMALGRLRRPTRTPADAYWPLEDCGDGTSGHTVVFRDVSGWDQPLTGHHGGNAAGLDCLANGHLSRPWGIQ